MLKTILIFTLTFFMTIPTAHSTQLTIPLQKNSGWEILQYSKIKPNKIEFTEEGIVIQVNGSASPLIFPLKEPLNIEEISFSLKIDGDIKLVGKTQGEKVTDDFVFRLGLVYEGDKTLNFLQRKLAANWIQRLFNLAPKGTGVQNIQFYNVYSDDRLKGKKRQHPLSELIEENFVFKKPENGELSASFKPNQQAKVLALWISSDGDDSGSQFQVSIKEIVITSR